MVLQTRSDMDLWDRPFQTLLLGVLALNVISHLGNVPVWVLILSGACFIWKILHLYKGVKLPPKKLLYLAGAITGLYILWTYKTAFALDAATPALVYLTSFKLLETNTDRDAKFMILTGYFLLMTHILYSQSLASTFFMAIDVTFLTILTFQLHRADRRLSISALKPVARTLIMTIPVWLILFLIFPRFNFSLFGQAQGVKNIGFSEELSAGSVNRLAQSKELAFRVQFHTSDEHKLNLSPESFYWRGATLYHANDLNWKPLHEDELQTRSRTSDSTPDLSEAISYQVLVEPSFGRTVFTLPYLAAFDTTHSLKRFHPYVTFDNQARLRSPKLQRITYTAYRSPEILSPLKNLSEAERLMNLKLPKKYSQKVKDLARKLQPSHSSSPDNAIRNIDEWFRTQRFRYSLDLTQTPSHTLDQFLFQSRRGFCEHFAASSATLLRLMGYPARVVVGYQGGHWNSFSQSFLIQNRDAHAWVEVWHPSTKNPQLGRWKTYDPTAVIAPLRIRMGSDFFDLSEKDQAADLTDIDLIMANQSFTSQFINKIEYAWDYSQMIWTQFLLSYDQSGQQDLFNQILAWLGLSASPLTIIFLTIGLLIIIVRILYIWNKRTSDSGRLQHEWAKLSIELKRHGYYQSVSDGLYTIRNRVPAKSIQKSLDDYIDFLYAAPVSSTHTKKSQRLQIKAQIKALRRTRLLLKKSP